MLQSLYLDILQGGGWNLVVGNPKPLASNPQGKLAWGGFHGIHGMVQSTIVWPHDMRAVSTPNHN